METLLAPETRTGAPLLRASRWALEVFLYHWVRAQRCRSAAGQLTARQERRLEAIPRWTVLGRDQLHTRHWDERFAASRTFVAEYGHLPRYKRGTTDRERTLGTWLSRQRARHRRGLLPAGRAAALDGLLADAATTPPPSR
ncbi:helicase associated domain-containing protein [Arthrobacter sp.]|uniref:helicase associated domain-containing protein n=1 Tax=Arthrobacter sp. TaxID=1667 RepID=UPI003A93850C